MDEYVDIYDVFLPKDIILQQSEQQDDYENSTEIKYILQDDAELFNFLFTFSRKFPLKLNAFKRLRIIHNGMLMKFPQVYYYFLGMTICGRTGKRVVSVGFWCWGRELYAKIDIFFYIHPQPSMYTQRVKYRLPYIEVKKVEVLHNESSIADSEKYIRKNVGEYIENIGNLSSMITPDKIRMHNAGELNSYGSYRLAGVLMYQCKLVRLLRFHMLSHCINQGGSCGSIYPALFNMRYSLPVCKCTWLYEEMTSRFIDAKRLCSKQIYFLT
jgi:hypothetical protein